MNEKYIINFSSLDSLKEKFENDKKILQIHHIVLFHQVM